MPVCGVCIQPRRNQTNKRYISRGFRIQDDHIRGRSPNPQSPAQPVTPRSPSEGMRTCEESTVLARFWSPSCLFVLVSDAFPADTCAICKYRASSLDCEGALGIANCASSPTIWQARKVTAESLRYACALSKRSDTKTSATAATWFFSVSFFHDYIMGRYGKPHLSVLSAVILTLSVKSDLSNFF